jgi:protoporphyrinogen oxidase
VTTVSFAAEEPPVRGPYLILNGEVGAGVVNQVAVMSEVSPRYAPAGLALITASIVGLPAADDVELVAQVRDELGAWFGPGVQGWRLLEVRRIEKALPRYAPPTAPTPTRPSRLSSGIYVCGDHRATPSLEGALRAGVEAAHAVIAQRRQPSGSATLPERPSRGV